MRHIAIVREDGASLHRMLLVRDSSGNWSVYTSGARPSLQGMVSSAVEMMKADPNTQFSFTTQALSDAFPLCERAEDLERWGRGVEIDILAPEHGEGDASLWNSAWHCPDTGGVTSRGKESRWRKVELADQIVAYFQKRDWRSFDPPTAWTAARELQFPVQRPQHHRCLLVRDWRIRDMCPNNFPEPKLEQQRRAHLAEVQANYEALRTGKDPREKLKRLQEQQARDRQLLTASPEERARLEVERKASFGREVRAPSA